MKKPDDDDLPASPPGHETLQDVVDRIVSRRSLLKGGLGLAASMILGVPGAGCSGDRPQPVPGPSPMGFIPVGASSGDQVIVPFGYVARAIAPWGSPLFSDSPPWRPDGSNTADDQARQVGDNHDGMTFVPFLDAAGKERSDEGLLVVNHEYVNTEYFYRPEKGVRYPGPWTSDKVRKAQNGHGVSVLHLRRGGEGTWEVVIGSPRNRRITGNTPMRITGPAAGDPLLRTGADPTGSRVLGTLNNCANGWTPWGTFLTCEENFHNYFGSDRPATPATEAQRRYGIRHGPSPAGWELHDPRFDLAGEPHESHRFGWVVEFDPMDPDDVPRKRTALGRFKHENAAVVLAADGRVVVYMGDDTAGDYIYKFVSAGRFDAARPAANRDLLDTGTLFVARFTDGAARGDGMGAGEWLALDRERSPVLAADRRFASQAEVLVWARLAADAVRATRMDRPEWVAVHPWTREVYCTLTSNGGRAPSDVNDANPRGPNGFGQIIRWREAGGDPGSTAPFDWDLFVLAGNPSLASHPASPNVTPENMFNCPDGIGFSPDGRLWIQTDGSVSSAGPYAGHGNNQMLCADPATRGIWRFLVGPSGCEITGQAFTPDQRTLFISIQHPGEAGDHPRVPAVPSGFSAAEYLAHNPLAFSQWPDPAGGRPRSAVVVVTRKDGGVIGS
ncbi:MAG: PhoX family phosphatase [Candidatus Brocadiae bacterium]|nr:PhoX family phosphatase [Candidatus Brocadiia bacterium]